jgi:16S rRNA (uracil1498-N3)-methyltransferase
MPISRLYIDADLAPGRAVDLPEEQAHYLRQVMRLGCGDAVILFNGRGGEYPARVTALERRHARCEPVSFDAVDRELPCRIHIVQAANRSEKIETVLQKCTELGVASFQVCASERAAFRLDIPKRDARLTRWQRIIVEAAEQSGRTRVPDVRWVDALPGIAVQGSAYALHPQGETHWPVVRAGLATAAEVTLAVGPEGGWSARDLEALAARGFQPLQFGTRILRTETAAPALTAALQGLLG